MATSLNQMTIELGHLDQLTPDQFIKFKQLFKLLLEFSKGPDINRVRGNITVSLDGNGGIGQIKVERFVNLEK